MPDPCSDVCISPNAHATTDANGGLVLLNEKTGQWHVLNPMGRLFWQQLELQGPMDAAITAVAGRYPHVDAGRIRDDLTRLAAALTIRGLLVAGAGEPRDDGAAMALGSAPEQRLSRADRCGAWVAFACALVLLRLPFRHTTRIVAALKRHRSVRPASVAEAHAAVHAAHQAARWYPGRAACLELSLTAVLTAALRRRRLDWCFGAATDPRRLHAWTQAEGQPVTHPTDQPLTQYTHVLTI